jgi:hypothetical protein
VCGKHATTTWLVAAAAPLARLRRNLPGVFLGEDLLAWLILALGGALCVGNVLAVVRPPATAKDGELQRAPVGRSITMAAIGLVAAIWAIASLLK